MWDWLKKKLGIIDYSSKLIDLDTKLYESIKLDSKVLDSLNECTIELANLEATIKTLQQKLEQIESKIKAIPKEMTIKNILSI